MSPLPLGLVTIVGARTADLDALVRGCGVQTASLPSSDLHALAHPGARPTPTLVVDLRGDAPVFPVALAEIKRLHPRTAIVLAASTLAPAMMLDAMRAGVTECLIEPLSADDVRAALQRIAQQHQQQPPDDEEQGQVFAVIGAKGGVGATTLAVNLATEIAVRAPRETLLVDLHVTQGDAAILLGVEPRFSVADALENTHRFDEAFFTSLVTPTKAGPGLLASSDRVLGEGAHTSDRVRALLACAGRLYRYVVVDLPRVDASALDALDRAARLVVVTNQELPAIRSAARLVGALRERYGRERVQVALARFDGQADLGRDDLEKAIGQPIAHVLPSDYRLALRALNAGRPLALSNHNKLSAAYHAMALDLAGFTDGPTPAAPGLFARLAGRRA